MESEGAPLIAAGGGELLVQHLGAHPDAHGGDLKGLLQHRVPQQNVAVEVPVVIVGSTAVVGLTRLERAADLHEEGGGMILHPGVLPLLGGEVGPAVLQLLGGDKAHLRAQGRQRSEPGVDRAQGGLGLTHGLDDGAYGLLQILHVPVPGSDDLLPVPLIHIDRVQVIQLFVPPDGVHVGVESLSHRELIPVEGHTLPLGQRVDHLGVPARGGDVKGDGPLHTVQVVVQAGGRLDKQWGGDPHQIERASQCVLKKALEKADGLLGIIQVEAGSIARRDDGLFHTNISFYPSGHGIPSYVSRFNILTHYNPQHPTLQEWTQEIAANFFPTPRV